MDNEIFYLRKIFHRKQQEEPIYLLHKKAQGAWSPDAGIRHLIENVIFIVVIKKLIPTPVALGTSRKAFLSVNGIKRTEKNSNLFTRQLRGATFFHPFMGVKNILL
ncbi:hypothetical protein [Massilibacterium senegalense]|uniref:hypothetical protein n=1 Tax=Massilibacterium senegalense TaxID=1632858 RepID=UPI0011CB9FC4|nr:hypothetical protein [Massilibacterium senegalense]